MLYSLVGILVVILDQAVKFWVQNSIFGNTVVKFIPGVLSIVNVHNTGAAFGILSGSNARIYFIAVAFVFALAVVIALATNFITGRLARWSLVMVTAGGLANMIDRVMYGYVQDMFKVELFDFAIFNVADVFITVFAILFAVAMIFEKPEDDIIEELYQDEEEEEEEDDDAPARKSLVAKLKEKREASRSASKKARQEKYEREYEEYRAQQLEAMHMGDSPVKSGRKSHGRRSEEMPSRRSEEQPARRSAESSRPREEQPARRSAHYERPQPTSRRSEPAADPFAAWEQASARHETQRSANYAESAMGTGVRSSAAAQRRPVRQEPEVSPAAPVQAEPVRPAQPKPQPKSVSSEEFNLDDILAEFK